MKRLEPSDVGFYSSLICAQVWITSDNQYGWLGFLLWMAMAVGIYFTCYTDE